MDKAYKVMIDGHVVEWRDGEFRCNNRAFLKKVKDAAKKAADAPYIEIMLDGSTLYGGRGAEFEKAWAASYALLQTMTGGRMKFVSGERPTWEKLGYKTDKNAVY